jgi:hypothetical protein
MPEINSCEKLKYNLKLIVARVIAIIDRTSAEIFSGIHLWDLPVPS